jgi:hypothetical protein
MSYLPPSLSIGPPPLFLPCRPQAKAPGSCALPSPPTNLPHPPHLHLPHRTAPPVLPLLCCPLQDDPRWYIADPICTFLFALLVLWTTCAILRDIGDVLMERVPRGLCINTINDDFSRVGGWLGGLRVVWVGQGGSWVGQGGWVGGWVGG